MRHYLLLYEYERMKCFFLTLYLVFLLDSAKIDPPKVSLTGCGDCIQVNISLHKNIEEFYPLPHFTISLKKPNEAEKVYNREKKIFTLENLQKGQEYCVKVRLESNLNKNIESSAWTCTFTSIEEQRRGRK
eukprot:superscaffoldBa00004280_g18587